MATFDRYLLRNFLHVFVVCFIATFGLVVVIDLLENIDDFIDKNGDAGTGTLVATVSQHYAYQSIFFLDRSGPIMTVIAVMVVLVLFQRSGELHPMLAAGVPMLRVLRALLVGPALVNVVLVANQELVVPRIAHMGHGSRSAGVATHTVEPIYDYSTKISIDGASVSLGSRTVEGAQFVLPAPGLVNELTILQAKQAVFKPAQGRRPDGWLLKGATPAFADLSLTAEGKKIVHAIGTAGDVFVTTPVSCDQLFKRNSSHAMLSTAELIDRVRCPAYGPLSVQQFVTQVHARLTQPLLNMIAVFLALPMMVRRESKSLVLDSAMCAITQGSLFGIIQASLYLSKASLIAPDLAAWVPVIVGGGMCSWLAWLIRS